MVSKKEAFFTKDPAFFHSLFSMLLIVALQNVIAYSVNMADNIMLGSYSQTTLSGAAIVNQVFFIVQQATISIGDGLIAISSQYWGKKNTEPICQVMGMVLRLDFCIGLALVFLCGFFAHPILSIFTNDPEILEQGCAYLSIIKYTFLLFIITQSLLAALRSVETVGIAFSISCVSLVLNIGINYTLIFGHFKAPELGIRGASIGTLVSRFVELGIVLVYLLRKDQKLRLFERWKLLLRANSLLAKDYRKVAVPVLISSLLWSVSIPLQTAILGHLSADAIAANSVATTFYQYMKVIIVAMSSTSAVLMGKAIGTGNMDRVRSDARTLSVIDVCIGLVLALILYVTRGPLLSHYALNPTAAVLADQLIVIMSVVMIGMSYQMPVGSGIIRGSGDAKFSLYVNLISTWCIVTPLSFAAAFWWKLPIPVVVLFLQSDQIFKCLPIFLRFRSYHWIKKLTR